MGENGGGMVWVSPGPVKTLSEWGKGCKFRRADEEIKMIRDALAKQ